MVDSEHAQERRWREWAGREAFICLAGKPHRTLSLSAREAFLPDAFHTWLLDQDRWRREGLGDAWGCEASPRAAEFIRRSVDAWPDEDLLEELRRETRNATSLDEIPPNRARILDLLAWWIMMDRGLVPDSFDPKNPRHRVYGNLVTTHVGKAVHCGLSNRHLAYETGEITPAVEEAYLEIFDTSFGETLDRFYKEERAVADKSLKYERGKGQAWAFLHRCIERFIDDFLDRKDMEVNVPNLTMADRFRRMLRAAERQTNPSAFASEESDRLSQGDQIDLIASGNHRYVEDPEEEEWDDAKAAEPGSEVLVNALPVAKVAFFLKYAPPTDWNEIAIERFVEDFGLQKGGREHLKKLLIDRSNRLELARIRRDACFEKREYLRVLKERTREGLKKALSREGHSKDQIRQRIDLLEKQASGGEVLLGEVRAVQKDKNCPVDSQVYLAARFQELMISEEKMGRYAVKYNAQWEDRYTILPEEMSELAAIFTTDRECVRQQLAQIERALGLE
jgi:hypothetical protein